MAINPLFNAAYYLNENPDVRAALDPISAEGAWEHYITYGANEGRAPNAWFDADYYFTENPDLANAGLKWSDLLDHFYNYGAAEGRAPNADVNAGTWLAYALAPGNADLREAYGIDDDATELTQEQINNLSNQYFHWGIDEPRESPPVNNTSTPGDTFNLTPGIDTLTGTPGDDVFNAYDFNPVAGDPATTLNSIDSINGGGGNDTLNIFTSNIDGEAYNKKLDARTTIKNVETINIYNQSGGPFHSGDNAEGLVLDASRFEGAKLINQDGVAVKTLTNLAEGVTAGYSNMAMIGRVVEAADIAKSASVQLNNVGLAGDGNGDPGVIPSLVVNGNSLSNVNITGSVAEGVLGLILSIEAGKNVQTVTLNTEVDTGVFVDNAGGKPVSTLDASASTGGLLVPVLAEEGDGVNADLRTILTGSGDDIVVVNTDANLAGKTITIDTGAGDDLVLLGPDLLQGAARLNIDLGEGDDTLKIFDVASQLGARDVIDGGEGFDRVEIDGSGALTADDYVVFNEILRNFEEIAFTDDAGSEDTPINASRLSAYESFVFVDSGGFIEKVSDDQSLTVEGWGDLVATASGYTVETPAGHLNVTVMADDFGTGNSELTLNAKSADIVVDNSDVELAGDLLEARVSLVTTPDEDGDIDDIENTYFEVYTEDIENLESLVISGTGIADVYNDEGTKLTYVDASGMDFAKDAREDYSGLVYESDNVKAETIILGDGVDEVTLNASIYQNADGAHTFDSVHNFNFVNEGGKFAADSDKLIITALNDVTNGIEQFDASGYASLNLALKAAANENEDGAAIFEYAGNTYVFVDSSDGGGEILDDGDTVVEIVGTFADLGALAAALDAAVV